MPYDQPRHQLDELAWGDGDEERGGRGRSLEKVGQGRIEWRKEEESDEERVEQLRIKERARVKGDDSLVLRDESKRDPRWAGRGRYGH